jgi:hypothetical protein
MGKRRTSINAFLKHFLWAGSIALLLILGSLTRNFILPPLVALAIFIWRARRTDFYGTVLLGVLTASLYLLTLPLGSHPAPSLIIKEWCCLGLAFSAFGAVVNLTAKLSLRQPFVIAFLSIPISLGLAHFSHSGEPYHRAIIANDMLLRVASLFGSLVISFFIIFINSLIILAIEKLNNLNCGRKDSRHLREPISCPNRSIGLLKSVFEMIAENRAPPPLFLLNG